MSSFSPWDLATARIAIERGLGYMSHYLLVLRIVTSSDFEYLHYDCIGFQKTLQLESTAFSG